MGADKITRRALLTAGGLTVLGIYAADPACWPPATTSAPRSPQRESP